MQSGLCFVVIKRVLVADRSCVRQEVRHNSTNVHVHCTATCCLHMRCQFELAEVTVVSNTRCAGAAVALVSPVSPITDRGSGAETLAESCEAVPQSCMLCNVPRCGALGSLLCIARHAVCALQQGSDKLQQAIRYHQATASCLQQPLL